MNAPDSAVDDVPLSDSELLEAWSNIASNADAVAVWPPELRARAIKLARGRFPINGDSIAERALGELDKSRPARFPHVWLDDAEPPTSMDDYIKNVMPKGAFVVVFGPSGDGKTFFTGDMMLHVSANDLPWRDHRTRGDVLVVWVAAEGARSALTRFCAARDHHIPEQRDKRLPFVIITRGANLLNPVDVEGLILELQEIAKEAGLPVGIVVFDTWSRSMPGGDESGSKDMTECIDVADRIRSEFGATVVAVHHSGKDLGRGARGHTSLYAAADVVISVVEKIATIEKSRDGECGAQFPFDLKVVELGTDEDGDPITTCIVEPINTTRAAKPKTASLSGVAKVALQALQEAVSEHGEVMSGTSTIPAGVRAATIEAWRSRFGVRYGSDGEDRRDATAIRKAFQRGREALLKSGCIQISNPYVWTA